MYTLYDFGPSPFCLKVRAALDFKGIDYRRINIQGPGFARFHRRSPTGQVPALEVDGTVVTDSTEILYWLDSHHPEPALWPSDAALRSRCHLLEDWADESLYWYGIYYRWQEPEGIRSAGVAFPKPLRAVATQLIGAGARRRLSAQGMGRRPAHLVALELDRHLEMLALELRDTPWLLGEAPYACDIAVASQLLYLWRTPFGRPRVEAHAALMGYLDAFRTLRKPH